MSTIIVENIPETVDGDELYELFEVHGKIRSFDLKRDSKTEQRTGLAQITYLKSESAA